MAISDKCYVTKKSDDYRIPCLVKDLFDSRTDQNETLYSYIQYLLKDTSTAFFIEATGTLTFPSKRNRHSSEVTVVDALGTHNPDLIIQNTGSYCWSAAAFSFLYQTKLYERIQKKTTNTWFALKVLTRSQKLTYCSPNDANVNASILPQSTGFTFKEYVKDVKYWEDGDDSDSLQRDFAASNQYGVEVVTATLKSNDIPHVALRLECDMPFKTLYNKVMMTLTHPEDLSKYTNVGCIAIVEEPGKTNDKHYLCIVPQPYVQVDRVSIIDPNDDKIVTQKPKWRYWTARVTHVTWILVETDPVKQNLSAKLKHAA